jgi:hypothetical protein
MPTIYKHSLWLRVHRIYWYIFYSLFLFFIPLACTMSFSVDTSTKNQPTKEISTLKAVFIGQDGGNYAGKLCSSGTKSDNVHIHLSGIRVDSEPVAFRVDDYAKGGVWATPCDPVSNWFLYVKPIVNGETDIYFKPFRDAPEGTEYKITVTYDDGTTQITIVDGKRVKP